MKIELRRLDEVRPYVKNPRRNEAAVDAVAASIRDFGFRKPIVVDAAGVILCGHTCFEAARRLGLEQVPVHVAADLSPEQAKALRIADNKTAELAEWDWDLLADELRDLEAADVDVEAYGFTVSELAEVLSACATDGLVEADACPPIAAKPCTRRGDLYVLGPHRLLCGDSSSWPDVERLIGGEPVDAVNTDPPYGVAVQPRGAKDDRATLRAKDRPLMNDELAPAAFAKQLNAWFSNLSRALKPGRSFYVWGGYSNFISYPGPLRRAGLHFAQAIVWIKNQAVLSRQDFNTKHEWCFYGWRDGEAHRYFGPDNAVDVWEVAKVAGAEMVHLTQKPVELAERALQYSTLVGERVLDLFGGSGTTLIAAHRLERRACLMELDPLYCDVIVRRWEQFTGEQAQRFAPGAEVPHGETQTTGRRGRVPRPDAIVDGGAGQAADEGGRRDDRRGLRAARPGRRSAAQS